MPTKEVSPTRLAALRGKRSREVIAHELRKLGHGTDAKAIWRYETGRNQPSARVLSDYAAVLGVGAVEDLYGNGSDENAEADDDSEAARAMSLDAFLRIRVREILSEERKERGLA